MKKFGLFIFALVAMSGCSTTPTDPGAISNTTSQSRGDYKTILENWTRKDQAYNNFAASFQLTATLLSRELIEEQVRFDGERFNWSPEEIEAARQKALSDLQNQTTFFVSLYTDRDEDNNLDKSSPAWNLFLDVNGKRVAPQQVKRIYENRVSLLQKYPSLNVWSRNYYVKFPIPCDDASSGGATLTLAGPVGSSHLRFK